MIIRIGNYIVTIETAKDGQLIGTTQFDEVILITTSSFTLEGLRKNMIVLIKNFEKHQKAHQVSDEHNNPER